MAFRVVIIENEVGVSVKLNNLIVTKNGEETWIPIDDISMIVMDNLATTISCRMLNQLAEAGIGMIICDQKHLPIGYYGAYDNHSRSSKVLKYQLEKREEYYGKLWKEIVEVKIRNQAEAYDVLSKDKEGKEKIRAFADQVEMGDITNREAHAAKVYFNLLMGTSFSRGNEEILLNSGLDYGYAIIRGYIARLCVGYGLNTQIGIHHKSEYNRFNLVDDLMEVVRPFVDIVAYKLLITEEYFKPEHRHTLVGLLNFKIQYHGKNMFFSNMLDDYIAQVSSYLQDRRRSICFPDVYDSGWGLEDEI